MSYIARLSKMTDGELYSEIRHLHLCRAEVGGYDREIRYAEYEAWHCRSKPEIVTRARQSAQDDIRERRTQRGPLPRGKQHGDRNPATAPQQ